MRIYPPSLFSPNTFAHLFFRGKRLTLEIRSLQKYVPISTTIVEKTVLLSYIQENLTSFLDHAWQPSAFVCVPSSMNLTPESNDLQIIACLHQQFSGDVVGFNSKAHNSLHRAIMMLIARIDADDHHRARLTQLLIDIAKAGR